ncbi:uncharacterized protein [Antedon mediterranea]|uniref:uncharacterized protein n=1 Tax=Antedon mediterranea TaxID=105859 RepID=UPI003AF718DB
MTKPKKRKIVSKSESQKKKSELQANIPNGKTINKPDDTTSRSTYIYLVCITFVLIFTALYFNVSSQSINFDVFKTKNTTSGNEKNAPLFEQIQKMETIHRRANLSLAEFQAVYDGKWPVLITDVMQRWPAINWTTDFFLNSYGEDRITMKAVRGSLNKGESFALPLKLYLSHINEGTPDTWTYLEDEIFLEQRPKLKEDIITPVYLQEDYFQMFPPEIQPWNAMLLWGTRFSRSSLHIDPYNWTGTNAVFMGLKKWKLYEPGQDHYLYVYPDRKSEFPLNCNKYNSPIDTFNPDYKKYPLFKKARAIEFDQHPGEMLIIPTGWFHQAYNDDVTMAVSSQVMNSGNYEIVIEEILKVNKKLKRRLPDNFQDLGPVEKVSTLMRLMPKDILKRGREVNDQAVHEINKIT